MMNIAETWLSERSVQRTFKELGRFAYHIQVAQYLTETDEWAQLQYCNRVLSMTYEDSDFFSNIWFSDESHIPLMATSTDKELVY